MSDEFQKITQPYILQLEDNLQDMLEKNSNELECEITGFLFAKSKRLRPIFTYLCTLSLDCKIDEDVQNLALCVELLHSATLVHDDILDESEMRREKQSFFRLLGAKKAVIIGDYLLSLALLALSKIKNPKVVEIFAKNVLSTINGEINQFDNCFKFQDKETYLEKCALKTASLFVCCALGVCELNGATLEQTQKLENFAKKFGTLFQMRNDIDNFINSEGEDIKNGVYTICPIYLKQEAPDCDIMNITKEQVQLCVSKAQEDLDRLANEAISLLDEDFNSVAVENLSALCKKIRG